MSPLLSGGRGRLAGFSVSPLSSARYTHTHTVEDTAGEAGRGAQTTACITHSFPD